MADERIFDFGERNRPAGCLLQRGDAAIRDAAGDDQPEVIEIRGHVEGKAVTGDPARDADADGADLLGTNPRPGQAGNASGRHAILRADANHDLFDVTYVD